MFWHPIILTQQMSPVGWLHYKSSLTGGRDALPQRVLARTTVYAPITFEEIVIVIIMMCPIDTCGSCCLH